MKRSLVMAAVLAAVVLVLIPGGCAKKGAEGEAQTAAITLTYANFPPAPTFPCVQMERWKEEVEKRTGGKVKIDTFPGGTLLDAKQMMDGVIAGQADIGCLCMAYQPGRFTVTNATSLPLDIPNAKVGSQVLLDLYEKYQPESFAEVKVLTMFTTAPSNIMSKKPIRTLEDLQGVPIRASGGAVAIMEAWGASANGMPMSDTPEALQKGVVQGLFSSAEVLKDFKYAEMCKYVTMTDTVIYPFAVVMNKAKWDSLPADVQQVMDALIREQCTWTGNYMDEHVQESLEWSKETHGVEMITLDAAQKQQWNAKLQPITDTWIADAKSKGFAAEEIVAFLKGKIADYSKTATAGDGHTP